MRKRVSRIPALVEPTHESHATLETVDHTLERFSLRQAEETPLTRHDIVIETGPSNSARHGARF